MAGRKRHVNVTAQKCERRTEVRIFSGGTARARGLSARRPSDLKETEFESDITNLVLNLRINRKRSLSA